MGRLSKVKFYSSYRGLGYGWFRLFGYGVSWKDYKLLGLSFSERYKLKPFLRVGHMLFSPLTPTRPRKVLQ